MTALSDINNSFSNHNTNKLLKLTKITIITYLQMGLYVLL